MLEELDYYNPVNIEDSRIDKLSLTIRKLHEVEGTPSNIDSFREFLSTKELRENRGNENFSIDDYVNYGWIYGGSKNSSNTKYRNPLEIRTSDIKAGNGNHLKAPLISGKMNFSKYTKEYDDGFNIESSNSKITYELHLNPTRFIHHHPEQILGDYDEEFSQTIIDNWTDYLVLKARNSVKEYDGEFPLMGGQNYLADNWIPRTNVHNRFISNHNEFTQRTHSYINIVYSTLLNSWDRAIYQCPAREIQSDDEIDISLKYIEIYWEFTCNNPNLEVLRLEDILKNFSQSGIESRKYKRDREIDRDLIDNSRRLIINLQKNIELAVYSKTNRRIRFEVRYKFEKGQPSGILPGIVTHDISTLVNNHFRLIKINAVSHMENVFSHIYDSQVRQNVSSYATVSEFLLLFHKAVPDQEMAACILSNLIINERINTNPYLKDALSRLRKGNILKNIRRNSRRGNVIKEKYRDALSKLKELDLNPLVINPRSSQRTLRRRLRPNQNNINRVKRIPRQRIIERKESPNN